MSAANRRRGKSRLLTQREITEAFEEYWKRNGERAGNDGGGGADKVSSSRRSRDSGKTDGRHKRLTGS
jgi:hypothetical protein